MMQPTTSLQDQGLPQLRAAGNSKRIEDLKSIDLSKLTEVASVAQLQQLQNGVPISGVAPASTPGFCTYDLSRNQFFLNVPGGAANLRVTLTGSPSGADIDLAVRFNQPVNIINGQLISDFVSQSPGSFEEIFIPNPLAGTWYVAVGNCELFSVSFTLVASFAGGSIILQLDDGSFENVLGYPDGASSAYFVNRITPSSYPVTLTTVLIYFDPRAQSLPSGFPITIVVGTSSGSSNIDGIFLRRSSASVGPTGRFTEYPVAPVTIFSGDIVVGFVTSNPLNTFPAAYDETFPRRRSYTTTDGFDFHQVEEFSTIRPGNFAIRARVQASRPFLVPGFSSQAVSDFVPPEGMIEYEFDPVGGARYRFSTCDGFGNFDTVIEVFQNGALLTRNDDCGLGLFSLQSTVELTIFSTARAIVRVRGFSSSSSGNYTMVYRRVR